MARVEASHTSEHEMYECSVCGTIGDIDLIYECDKCGLCYCTLCNSKHIMNFEDDNYEYTDDPESVYCNKCFESMDTCEICGDREIWMCNGCCKMYCDECIKPKTHKKDTYCSFCFKQHIDSINKNKEKSDAKSVHELFKDQAAMNRLNEFDTLLASVKLFCQNV